MRTIPVVSRVLNGSYRSMCTYPLTTRDRFTADITDAQVVARIRQYVTDFTTRHAGKIYVWDAANKVIGDDGHLMDERGLRTHWYGDVNRPVRGYQVSLISGLWHRVYPAYSNLIVPKHSAF
jgi:hypothetical protein